LRAWTIAGVGVGNIPLLRVGGGVREASTSAAERAGGGVGVAPRALRLWGALLVLPVLLGERRAVIVRWPRSLAKVVTAGQVRLARPSPVGA